MPAARSTNAAYNSRGCTLSCLLKAGRIRLSSASSSSAVFMPESTCSILPVSNASCSFAASLCPAALVETNAGRSIAKHKKTGTNATRNTVRNIFV